MRTHPIALWMKRKGIKSQTEAAFLLGITQPDVSDYIAWRATPRPARLHHLARQIGVPPGRFLPDASVEER